MGIKFKCPNGHKLNVKAFLAGKRGICPHCGIKVDIPLEDSNGKPSGQAATFAQAPAAGSAPAVAGYGGGQIPSSAPHAGNAPHTMPAIDTAAASPVPVEDAPRIATTATAAPAATSLPAAAVAAVDPIAESPTALWYVRPASGGQFGPAAGDVMLRWIGEGRVDAGSLVWREGWADWKTASDIFPQFGAAAKIQAPAATPSAVAPYPTVASGASSPATVAPTETNRAAQPKSRPSIRRKSNAMLVTMIVLLVVSVVGLMGVLIWVLVA